MLELPICYMQRPAGQFKSEHVCLTLFKNTHVLCLFFRMDYEFIAKGFFFHKGRMKVTVSKLYKVGSFVITVDLLCGPGREKTCLRGLANNTGADQPAHLRSLISAFVIRLSESIICKLATGEISIFKLVSVAEETGLKLALSEIPKTCFVATRSM